MSSIGFLLYVFILIDIYHPHRDCSSISPGVTQLHYRGVSWTLAHTTLSLQLHGSLRSKAYYIPFPEQRGCFQSQEAVRLCGEKMIDSQGKGCSARVQRKNESGKKYSSLTNGSDARKNSVLVCVVADSSSVTSSRSFPTTLRSRSAFGLSLMIRSVTPGSQ